MNEIYHLLYACSDLYSKIAGISMESLFRENKDIDICVHILADNVSEANKERMIRTAEKYNQEIEFINIEPYVAVIEELGIVPFRSSPVLFVVFFVERYIPKDIQRIVYVDSDWKRTVTITMAD